MSSQVSLPPHVSPLRAGDPTMVGGYLLLGRLGSGGMGVVFAAVSPELERVAVKMAHPDQAVVEDFARELALMRRVEGVCGIGVHDSGTFEGRPWAAIEYVPGVSLFRHVREEGRFEGQALVALAAGCAEALAAIHGAGVAHGDIKPGNVLVSPEGPKVVDYGIARRLAEPDLERSVGSPGWLAPERYRGRAPDTASDVFAWGCLVAFAASGDQPFGVMPTEGEVRSRLTEMARRAHEDSVDLSAVPEGLRAVVGRALSQAADERPGAEEAYLECLVQLGKGRDTPPTAWAGHLSDLLTRHWPRVDISWDQPAKWASAAIALNAASAPGGDAGPWSALLEGGGQGAGGAGAGAAAPGGLGAGSVTTAWAGESAGTGASVGGVGGGLGAAGGAGGTATALGTSKVVSLAVAGAVGIAAATGGGYLLIDNLGAEEQATAAQPEEEEPETYSGMELVEASRDTFLEAGSFELIVVERSSDESGVPQELRPEAPNIYHHILYEDDLVAWDAHFTWDIGASRDFFMAFDDQRYVPSPEDPDLWEQEAPAEWYGENPDEAPLGGDVPWGYEPGDHDPEALLRALTEVIELGAITAESEEEFTPPAHPSPEEREHPAPYSTHPQTGGEVDPVPAVRLEGNLNGPEFGSVPFVFYAEPTGVPLYLAWDGAAGDNPVQVSNAAMAQSFSGTLMASFFTETGGVPYYGEQFFVGFDEDMGLELPDSEDVVPWEE